MKLIRLAGCLVAIVALMRPSAAPAAAIIHQTFETDDGGWMGIGPDAGIALAHLPEHVKVGKGSLQFEYGVNPGDLNAAILPITAGSLAKAQSITFWIKSNYGTTAGLALIEKGGARYFTIINVSKNVWQQVELAPGDFSLNIGAGAPPDPDNRLDMDQVNSIALIDTKEIFAQGGDDPLNGLLHIVLGTHTLYLDEFTISDEPLPAPAHPAPPGVIPLDNYDRPQIAWAPAGSAQLSRAQGAPLAGPSLKIEEAPGPDQVAGWIHGVNPGALVGATELDFTAAALQPAYLLIQVEETDGGKYNTTVHLSGDSTPTPFKLKLASFKAGHDSKDKNDRLDLDLVKQIVILDVSGIVDPGNGPNTLWMNGLQVSQ